MLRRRSVRWNHQSQTFKSLHIICSENSFLKFYQIDDHDNKHFNPTKKLGNTFNLVTLNRFIGLLVYILIDDFINLINNLYHFETKKIIILNFLFSQLHYFSHRWLLVFDQLTCVWQL